MPLFKVPERPGRVADKAIASKSRTRTKAPTTVKGGGLLGQLNQIKAVVEKNLGQFKDDYIIIREEYELHNYLIECKYNGVISIDTETTGLDPLQDDIVGLCIYTPNQPAAYVPINHVSYVTGVKVDNQLSKDIIRQQFDMLLQDNPDIIMFNAKFDIRFMRNQLGLKDIYCTWDCYLASRLMNENEEHKGLKALHKKYVLNGQGDAFSFDELFKGISFDKIPIDTGYLYAAHDAIITYELYDYQRKYLYYDPAAASEDRNGMNGVAWVFFNIEMPCVKVVCDMEDAGVKFDFSYQQQLSEKYNKLLEDKLQIFNKLCAQHSAEIDKYKAKTVNHKLDSPINVGSPTQVAILLYDILKIEPPDPKSPRGTGEKILQMIDSPIAKAILEYREMSKLVSTYIDKLPNCVNPNDGRIHCSFNQYGADTGRFSSSDPNLQNIPSRNHDIRKMFIATQEEKVVNFDTDDFLEVDKFTEIFTNDEWVPVSRFGVGDTIDIYGELFTISNIEEVNEKVRIYL